MNRDPFGFGIAQHWPEIDAAGMAEVDRLMVESLGITLPQMMENAGRALATLARDRYLAGDVQGRRIVVLAGSGGNGGGAMTAARRLLAWGSEVHLVLAPDEHTLKGVPADQLAIIRQIGLRPGVLPGGAMDLILDGLVGYSLQGAPRGRVAELIKWANTQVAPTLALDVPSGFDARIGSIHDPTTHADATLTLALPKRGLLARRNAHVTGALYLADISVPAALYARLPKPLKVPPFAGGDILRLMRPREDM